MFLFNCNYAILYYNITSYSPRQALIAPAVVSFYGLAGDSMHNMKFSLDLIPALGPIVSFKLSILCTSTSKTLPWPILMAVATLHKASAEGACSLCRAKATSPKVRRPRAASSPAKSPSPPASSHPSAPPAHQPHLFIVSYVKKRGRFDSAAENKKYHCNHKKNSPPIILTIITFRKISKKISPLML